MLHKHTKPKLQGTSIADVPQEQAASNKTALTEDQIAYQVKIPPNDVILVTTPIIDKITFVFSSADPYGNAAIKEGLLFDKQDYPEYLTNAPKAAWKTKRYKVNLHLHHAPTGQDALIQADPYSKKAKSFVRVELNPAKLGPAGMAFVRDKLVWFLGCQAPWGKIINQVQVTRVDLACDLVNVPIDQIAISTTGTGKSHVYFGIKGKIQTAYLAVKKGKSGTITVYNKQRQMKDTKQEPPYGPLPHTRVEFRVATKLHLPDFAKLVSPFDKIDLKYMVATAADVPDYAWAHFKDAVRYRGEKAALGLVPIDLRGPYEAGLNSLSSPLWRPHDIWANWPTVLASSGLIAD